MIQLSHESDDLLSSYTHVEPFVREGDEVDGGQPIGRIYVDEPGPAGCLPHLHQEMSYTIDGEPERYRVDPLSLILI